MKGFSIFSFALLIVFLISGCESKKSELSEKRLEREREAIVVDSVKLAEAILWPKPYRFSIASDPFKPLIDESSLSTQEDAELVSHPEHIKINIFGILKMEGDSIALLELSSGMSLVREGDKVDKYTVKSITPDRVILESEGQSRTLELGGEE